MYKVSIVPTVQLIEKEKAIPPGEWGASSKTDVTKWLSHITSSRADSATVALTQPTFLIVCTVFVYSNGQNNRLAKPERLHLIFRFSLVISGDSISGFASRPRIGRTPEPGDLQRNTAYSLAPTFSQAEPQQCSRPCSSSSPNGARQQSGGRQNILKMMRTQHSTNVYSRGCSTRRKFFLLSLVLQIYSYKCLM